MGEENSSVVRSSLYRLERCFNICKSEEAARKSTKVKLNLNGVEEREELAERLKVFEEKSKKRERPKRVIVIRRDSPGSECSPSKRHRAEKSREHSHGSRQLFPLLSSSSLNDKKKTPLQLKPGSGRKGAKIFKNEDPSIPPILSHNFSDDLSLNFLYNAPHKESPPRIKSLPDAPKRDLKKLIPAPIKTIGQLSSCLKKNYEKSSGNEECAIWHKELPVDWSLKSSLRVSSFSPFPFRANNLKTVEETRGTTACVRCIQIEPNDGVSSSGAQFYKSCLYWQHPSYPMLKLFPREPAQTNYSSNALNPLKFSDEAREIIFNDWVHSFRSAFQLLKARHCPYFYMCANDFTILFLSSGMHGVEGTRILVTPAKKYLRDSLATAGVSYSTPFYIKGESNSLDELLEEPETDHEAACKVLEDLGLSQNLSVKECSSYESPQSIERENSRSKLVVINEHRNIHVFFNFLLRNKSLLMSGYGPLAWIPPTIISPVGFHGGTLKQTNIDYSKSIQDGTVYTIELNGPILPHFLHQLCPFLNSSIKNYRICVDTIHETVPFNLYSFIKPLEIAKFNESNETDNEFKKNDSLSDSGFSKNTYEIFCRIDNSSTVCNGLISTESEYQWF